MSHEQQLQAAATTLQLAWTSDLIWWRYRGKETFAAYEPVRDRFVDFFRFDERAHLNNLIVHLWTLFDQDDDTISLASLMRDSMLPESEKLELQAVLSSVGRSKRKIAILRNNVVAHRNNSMTYNEVFALAEVSHDEMRTLLDVARAVLNRLRMAAGLSEWLPNDGTDEDTREMLQVLTA
jgi:hypothetical protein